MSGNRPEPAATQATASANPQSAKKFQSFNWIRGVSDDTRVSVLHRFILIRLLMHRQADGRCNPGYDTVAKELGVHRASVFRAVDVAVVRGWLAPPIRHGQANADFVFTFPHEVARERLHKVASLRRCDVAQSRRKRGLKSQRQRASANNSEACERNGHLTGKEREESDSRAPDFFAPDSTTDGAAKKRAVRRNESAAKPQHKSESEIAETFGRFWRAYPRKVAKEAARKVFAQAVEHGDDAEAMIAGAERFAMIREGEPERYTPHASRWLRERRWEDPPPHGAVIDQSGNVVEIEQEPEHQGVLEKAFAITEAVRQATGSKW